MSHFDMHWLDITILSIVGLAMLLGALSGFLRQVICLICYLIACYGAVYGSEPLAEQLGQVIKTPFSIVPRLVAFALIFVGLVLGLWVARLLIGQIIKAFRSKETDKTPKVPLGLKILDRLLGATVGGVLAALILLPIVLALDLVPSAEFRTKLAGSTIRPVFQQTAVFIESSIPQRFKDEFKEAWDRVQRSTREAVTNLGGEALQQGTELLNQAGRGIEEAGRSLKDATRSREGKSGADQVNGFEDTARKVLGNLSGTGK